MSNNKTIVHYPYDRFKNWLKENKVTYLNLSELLGINQSTVTSKINGQSDFLLSEVKVIKSKYDLSSNIFFTNDVA